MDHILGYLMISLKAEKSFNPVRNISNLEKILMIGWTLRPV